MPQYLLSVHHDGIEDLDVPAEQMEEMFAAVGKFNEEITEEGHWVFAGGLHPPTTATVVRNVDGEVLTTDGPYIETKEFLGGFWVITADDLDQALEIAARGSAACQGPVEVRPFQDE
ncbi:YciI family protein [Euzebya sp.]|uniref:YciI family protein n=1 Tax=Euzebya sp. TaxID=1971409 RepID=UPI003517D6B9